MDNIQSDIQSDIQLAKLLLMRGNISKKVSTLSILTGLWTAKLLSVKRST